MPAVQHINSYKLQVICQVMSDGRGYGLTPFIKNYGRALISEMNLASETSEWFPCEKLDAAFLYAFAQPDVSHKLKTELGADVHHLAPNDLLCSSYPSFASYSPAFTEFRLDAGKRVARVWRERSKSIESLDIFAGHIVDYLNEDP